MCVCGMSLCGRLLKYGKQASNVFWIFYSNLVSNKSRIKESWDCWRTHVFLLHVHHTSYTVKYLEISETWNTLTITRIQNPLHTSSTSKGLRDRGAYVHRPFTQIHYDELFCLSAIVHHDLMQRYNRNAWKPLSIYQCIIHSVFWQALLLSFYAVFVQFIIIFPISCVNVSALYPYL